jgi:hypothetical protein
MDVVTPSSVLTLLSGSTRDTLIAEVDKCMKDKNWVCNWRASRKDLSYWMISVIGTLSSTDKAALIELYKKAGWHNVVVRNSEDGGEAAGMCSITLYAVT